MNLSRMLARRAEEGRPVRVGIIGAGKFGAMYLSQARLTKGTHILGIADLDVPRARDQLRHIGWEAERYAATGFADALRPGSTFVPDAAEALIRAAGLGVLLAATGDPAVGLPPCLVAPDTGIHAGMVHD